jgi:hypothetical protein
MVAGAAFALVYFVQSKGWIYHAIPMVGCASMALAVLFAEEGLPRMVRLLAPAVLAFPLFLAADDQLYPGLPSPDLPGAISGLSSGDTVAFLSTEPALPWSVTLQRGYRYPSRYMGYWMMSAIIRNERLGSPDAQLTALGRQVVAETVQDFRCIPPRRIIVFFLRDPEFASLLAHYRPLGRTSLDVYEMDSPIEALPASGCRDGV